MIYRTYAFEKLEVWQLARKIKKEVYSLSLFFPKEEIYCLTPQLRRTAGSITANLAEGSGRDSNKEKAHYVNIAFSSGLEVLDHLITAFDLNYISVAEYEILRNQMDELLNKLNSFYRFQLNQSTDLKTRLNG